MLLSLLCKLCGEREHQKRAYSTHIFYIHVVQRDIIFEISKFFSYNNIFMGPLRQKPSAKQVLIENISKIALFTLNTKIHGHASGNWTAKLKSIQKMIPNRSTW